ncbi:MAG: ATP-binding protein [Thermodesulfobacteriota bacterium]
MPKQPQTHILLSDIPNPFLQDRVDSPWDETFRDVPDINRTAFQSIQNSIKAVHQGNQSRGLILHGEPGSGKTHLLQRLRFLTRKEPRTWFISIPPFPGPNRFWRHLLERFFYDICQRSKLPDLPGHQISEELPMEEGPGQGPLTQIEEALTRHLLGKPLSSTQELARLWGDICKQDPPGEPLFRRLMPTFNKLTVQFRLDPDVMKVIRHYLTWNNRSIAYAYLLGRDLPDEELHLLGVTQSLDDEERAKQAVLNFCRLAGQVFTIILAFDQIEGLQFPTEDLDGLRTFANNVVYLMTECSNLLILSAVLTSFLSTLEEAMHRSYYQRIAQDVSSLTLLTMESAKRLIEFRLGTQKELVDLQQQDPRRGPLWPFTPTEIEQLVPSGGLPARDLIRKVRHLFDEKGKVATPRIRSLDDHWNEEFEEELGQPIRRVDEGIYEEGLIKLLQIKPPRGYRVHRGMERDLHVLLEGNQEKVGVSISNSENMTSLAKHLKRLQEIINKKKVTRLIFLRDARLSISPTATVTQQRLKDLEKSGMHVVRPPAEAYAALNVLRRLWNKAAENDLTIDDSTVSMGQLKSWLAEKTPRPLQELIDACQETAAPLLADLSDKLLEILAGRWVMTIEEVAKKLTMNEADLARFATETPDVVGLLAGPPKVLFLNPEAVSRT